MPHVFDQEEKYLIRPKPQSAPGSLLCQQGMVKISDLTKVLPVTHRDIRRVHDRLKAENHDPYPIMGVREVLGVWYARLSVFAPYYHKHLAPKFKKVDPAWDTQTLLNQTGTFRLSDVHGFTPFTAHQLRHQSQRLAKPRAVMGVYKDSELKRYLVDMPVFRLWLGRLWHRETPPLPEQNRSHGPHG